jgi:dihydrofolate reductase
MRKLTYLVGVTLDGYIAAPDGSTDFFPMTDEVLTFLVSEFPETLPTHVRAQLGVKAANRRFDTVVMGRGTYELALDTGVTSPYRHLRQYVVSRTLAEIADPEVELVRGDPTGLVRRLVREDGLGIWLAGGGTLAGSLLPEIDELVVKLYPVVAGAGIPVLAAGFQPRHFRLADARTFGNGTVVSTYHRPRATSLSQ